MPVFVILHYLSEEMTTRCVDTLRATFENEAVRIVIVDNGSPNGSGARLQEKYADLGNCVVLLNEENLGFAQGNNLGYRYAVEQLEPEFVVVMNNDVLVEDTQFFEKVRRIYQETHFYVLGPDIYACAAGVHQNPMRQEGYTREQVSHIIKQRERWLAVYPLHFAWKQGMQRLKRFAKKMLGRKNKPWENPLAKQPRLENPVLHGACYIFSPRFTAVCKEAFDPGTFLYFEEDILHYVCKENGYLMVYDSSVCVKHLEDVSTNMAFRSAYGKQKMKYSNLVASAKVLLKRMEQKKET